MIEKGIKFNPDGRASEAQSRGFGFESGTSLDFFSLLSQLFKFLHNYDDPFHLDGPLEARKLGNTNRTIP